MPGAHLLVASVRLVLVQAARDTGVVGLASPPTAAAAYSAYCQRGDQRVDHGHARRVTPFGAGHGAAWTEPSLQSPGPSWEAAAAD